MRWKKALCASPTEDMYGSIIIEFGPQNSSLFVVIVAPYIPK